MIRRVVCAAVGCVIVVACVGVSVISGPRTVAPGDTVSYVLTVYATESASNVTVYVAADVPASWILLASSWVGTINGAPQSGTGTVVADPYPGMLPQPGAGFQRIWIADGPFANVLATDSAEMTLDFDASSIPPGEFILRFWSLSSAQPSTVGSDVVVVNHEARLFRFLRSYSEADGALEANWALTASHDGHSLLSGGYNTPEIAVFERDPLTGTLNHLHDIDEASVNGILDLTSSIGDHFYGVGEGATGGSLMTYERNPTTGSIAMIQLLTDGVGGNDGLAGASGVAISPDGLSVYVAASVDNAVSAFARDSLTGLLSFVEAEFDGIGGVEGLGGATEVTVSADGANVYVVGPDDDAIAVFNRDQTTSELSFVEVLVNGIGGVENLDGPRYLTLSPDDAYLYATARLSDSIVVFQRNPSTGQLSYLESYTEGVNGVRGLYEPDSIVVTPDSRYLAVTAYCSVAVFRRDPATGQLVFVQADYNDEAGVGPLYSYVVNASPDSNDLLCGAYQSFAIFTTRIFADGFEDGGTGGWSLVE